jgi:regulator of sigma E protease
MLVIQIVTFVVGLGFLIVIHEFGHYIAARSLKVEVEEFGIGFPPRAVRLFRAWGTDFTLNWIPLGGFVRPKGENDPSIPGGLAAASPWTRLVVLFAGPMMNLMVALILAVIIAYSIGTPVMNKVMVEQVVSDSPASKVGMQEKDLIISVNGIPIDDALKFREIIAENLGAPVAIVLERAGKQFTVMVTPRVSPPEGQGPIGFVMGNPRVPIGMGQAVGQGAGAIYDYVRNLVALPARIMQGQATPEESRVVGLKGMWDIYQQVSTPAEFANPLIFFMVLSVSLGVLNLLPIPALDGGRILLTLPEILFKRRIPPRYETTIHLIGFALLMIVFIYVNAQDFINPLQFPK